MNRPHIPHARQQQAGAVLFIAMVALVAMTIGALALYRNLESATGVAGNIGFRQGGVAATEVAVETALATLAGLANTNDHDGSVGYFATQNFGIANNSILTFDWNANGRNLGIQNGYQLWVVTHRLCVSTGAPTAGNCPESGNTVGQGSSKPGTQMAPGGIAPMFRITARAVGPRQAESIVQTIVF